MKETDVLTEEGTDVLAEEGTVVDKLRKCPNELNT